MTENAGNNGRDKPKNEQPAEKKKIKLSPAVQSWSVYFGQPVTVHLKREVMLMDFVEMMRLPVGEGQEQVSVGIAGPATFRFEEKDENGDSTFVEKGRYTDTICRVMLQPAPCGTRIMLLHRTDESEGQSGAVLVYVVDPEDIYCLSQVGEVPSRRVQVPDGQRIVTPD